MRLNPDGFNKFRYALALRESSDNYVCVNSLGFLGRYQFGRPRLFDFNISIDGWKPKNMMELPPAVRVLTRDEFLNDPQLQDQIFEKHILNLAQQISVKFPNGVERYSLSGLVAGAHLKGIGGVRDFLSGIVGADAYGTTITEYVEKFGGYDIVLPDPS